MAYLDPERDLVVLRIVYDGPARAGKTTSLTALGRSLGREVVCTGEEEGRTLYFDWMEYVGGLFEGRSIRCQVVTVPGQPELWPRRRALLESADAVVFVADSGEERLEADLEALGGLAKLLPGLEPPPPAVVLQANKRDLADAVPLDRIRRRLAGGEPVAVTESIAHEGQGIRETFVLAVRLALDRLREQVRRGALAERRPDADSAEELLAALQALTAEAPEIDPSAEPEPQPEPQLEPEPRPMAEPLRTLESGPVAEAEPAAPPGRDRVPPPAAPVSEEIPRPPDPSVPGGMVWPPVGGRVILYESAPEAANLRRLAAGGWADFGNPLWLIQSPGEYRFASLDEGRSRLVDWARWHTQLGRFLSPRRCVVLGESAPGSWRLWQIVGRQETLAALLTEAFGERDPVAVAELLACAGEALAELRLQPELRRLRPSIDSVGFEGGRPVFLGLLPALPPGGEVLREAEAATGIDDESGGGAHLHELGNLIGEELARWPDGRSQLLTAMLRVARRSQAASAVWRLVVSIPAQLPPSTGCSAR